jgi:uncharacterized protein (DUF302 family)
VSPPKDVVSARSTPDEAQTEGSPVTERQSESIAAQGAASETAGADAVVTKLSPRSVEATVATLSGLVSEKGMKLFAVIDHSGEARNVGLDLRDTKVVIFGSPQAGTPVMQAAPLAALDLPLKVLIWSDAGQTKVSYTAPSALAARYGFDDELTARLAGIDALTDAAIAKP